MIGVAIFPVRRQHNPRPGQSKDRGQFPAGFEGVFQRPIRQAEIMPPVELQDLGGGGRFFGTNRRGAIRSRFPICQVEHADTQSLTSTRDESSPHADLGVVRVWSDGEDIKWLFQRLHIKTPRHI